MNPINNPFITLATRAANEEWDEQQVRQELVFLRETGLTSHELGHELIDAIQAIANLEWSGKVAARIDGLISTFMAKVDQKVWCILHLKLAKAWLLRTMAGDTTALVSARFHCQAARSLILPTNPDYPTLQSFEGLLTALQALNIIPEPPPAVRRAQKLFKALIESADRQRFVHEHLDEFDDSVLEVLRQMGQAARQLGQNGFADRMERLSVMMSKQRAQKLLQALKQCLDLYAFMREHLDEFEDSVVEVLRQEAKRVRMQGNKKRADVIEELLVILGRLRLKANKQIKLEDHPLLHLAHRVQSSELTLVQAFEEALQLAIDAPMLSLLDEYVQELADQHRGLAFILARLNDYLASRIARPFVQAKSALSVGKLAFKSGQEALAQERLAHAGRLYSELGFLAGEAQAYFYTGKLFYSLHQHSEALEQYNKALPLCEKAGVLGVKAHTHLLIGGVLFFLKKHSEGLEQCNRALPLYEKEGDLVGQAHAHRGIGEALFWLKKHAEALEQYNRALPLYEKEGHLVGQAYTHLQIGEVLFFLYKDSEANERWNKALLLYEKADNLMGQAKSHFRIGRVFSSLHKHSEALERYNRALLLYEKVGDLVGQANTHLSSGQILHFLNKYSEALSRYEAALPLYKEANDLVGQAKTYFRKGRTLFFLHRHSEALSCYETALPLASEANDLVIQAGIHRAIGELLFFFRQYSKALSRYETARALDEKESDIVGQAETHFKIGQVLFSLNKYSEALSRYETARVFYEKASDIVGQANTFLAAGQSLVFLKRYFDAMSCYEAALPLYQEAGDLVGEAHTYQVIGTRLFAFKQHSDAHSFYEMALFLYQEAGDLVGQININKILGQAWWWQKQYERAYKAFMRTLEKIESIRHLQQREQWRRAITSKGAIVYHSMVALCLEMGHPEEAWHWAERSKARTLLELLSSTRPRLDTPKKRTVYSQWLRLEREVFLLEQRIMGSQVSSNEINGHYRSHRSTARMPSKEQRAELVALLSDVREKEALARKKLLAVLDEGRELIAVEVPEAPELARILCDLTLGSPSYPAQHVPKHEGSHTSRRPLLVQYFMLESDHYAVFLLPLWRVGTTEPLPLLVQQKRVPQGTTKQILDHFFNAVEAARLGMVSRASRQATNSVQPLDSEAQRQMALDLFATLPEKIGQAFLQPWWEEAQQQLANLIPEERQRTPTELILVPHGRLHVLPLHTATLADGTLLIEQYPLVYLPNATIARTLVKRRQVAYNSTGRLVMGPPGDSEKALDLKYSLIESQELADIWKLKEDGQPYTLTQMKIEVLQQYASQRHKQADGPIKPPRLERLHLATHSAFKFPDYLQSHILFHNERLTLTQLISDETLDFRGLRLCYLSSCESGIALIGAGDQLSGLVWALTYAGAEAVMASLWPVDDEAGYLMSTLFYDYWEKEGSLMAAYRQALLDIRDEPGFDNPYYWAPFVLFGNGF